MTAMSDSLRSQQIHVLSAVLEKNAHFLESVGHGFSKEYFVSSSDRLFEKATEQTLLQNHAGVIVGFCNPASVCIWPTELSKGFEQIRNGRLFATITFCSLAYEPITVWGFLFGQSGLFGGNRLSLCNRGGFFPLFGMMFRKLIDYSVPNLVLDFGFCKE